MIAASIRSDLFFFWRPCPIHKRSIRLCHRETWRQTRLARVHLWSTGVSRTRSRGSSDEVHSRATTPWRLSSSQTVPFLSGTPCSHRPWWRQVLFHSQPSIHKSRSPPLLSIPLSRLQGFRPCRTTLRFLHRE